MTRDEINEWKRMVPITTQGIKDGIEEMRREVYAKLGWNI